MRTEKGPIPRDRSLCLCLCGYVSPFDLVLLGNSVAGSGNDSGNSSDDRGVEGLRSCNGGFCGSGVDELGIGFNRCFGFRFRHNYLVGNAFKRVFFGLLGAGSGAGSSEIRGVDVVYLEIKAKALAGSKVVHRKSDFNYPAVVVLNSGMLGGVKALFPSNSTVAVATEEEVAVRSGVDFALQIFINEPHFSGVILPVAVSTTGSRCGVFGSNANVEVIGIPEEVRGSGTAVVGRTITPAVEAKGIQGSRCRLGVDVVQNAVNNGCAVLDLGGRGGPEKVPFS